MKSLTKKEIAKYLCNVLSPRGYNYTKLKFKDGEGLIEIEPIMHVRDEALLDAVFDKFVKQNKFKALKELPRCNEITSWNSHTVEEMVKGRKRGDAPKFEVVVELDSGEIRKALGLPRFSDKEIEQRATNLNMALIKATGIKIWAESDGTYSGKLTWEGNIIRDRFTKKTDMVAPRTKNIQHRFFFVLEDATVMLWANDAFNRRMSLFPKKYYSLPDTCQRLLRYLSLWDDTYLTLKQAADILDWKNIPNTASKIQQVERVLRRLRKENYIADWNRLEKTRGLKTTWFICGINTIRQMEKPEPKEIEAANSQIALMTNVVS